MSIEKRIERLERETTTGARGRSVVVFDDGWLISGVINSDQTDEPLEHFIRDDDVVLRIGGISFDSI